MIVDVADIDLEKLALHERLQNWARWARDYNRSAAICFSAESRYISPWPENEEAKARTAIDLLDAVAVERAIRGVPLPHQKPLVLFWVMFRAHREASGEIPVRVIAVLSRHLARRYHIGISRHILPRRIAAAEHMVRNRLDTLI